MKPQSSNLKLQGNLKSQAQNGEPATQIKKGSTSYAPAKSETWVLNDEASSDAPARHPFDLAERTAKFEAIIRFAKKIPHGPGNNRLIDQLVGCGTSVGANYCEANEKASKRDFTHSVSRCAKEAHETNFFLRMVAAAETGLATAARELYREANELHLIFAKIFRKGRGYSR